MSRSGAHVPFHIQANPTPSLRSALSEPEQPQQVKSITARRMISGRVLKHLNGERFVIRRGYETALHGSSWFCLTVPYEELYGQQDFLAGRESYGC